MQKSFRAGNDNKQFKCALFHVSIKNPFGVFLETLYSATHFAQHPCAAVSPINEYQQHVNMGLMCVCGRGYKSLRTCK